MKMGGEICAWCEQDATGRRSELKPHIISSSSDQSMDSNMDTSNGMNQINDTKPDIMQLNINAGTTSAPFSGLMGGITSSSRYSQSGGSVHVGYPLPPSGTGGPSGGYFDMGRLSMFHSPGNGGGGGGISPSQSPALHSSQSSMSSHSPGGDGSASGFMSPTSTMGPSFHSSQGGLQTMGAGGNSNNMQSMTKHICAICGDRASGKHYGVYSCEGCKGFFKRTVRKDLQYACRDEKACLIDKRQRNRCQYCRYLKCLSTGMKREAVQEERQRAREKGEVEVESTTSANSEMPVEMILDAEMSVNTFLETYVDNPSDPVACMYQAAEKQVYSLIEWVKHVPHFTELTLEDQVILLRAAWNELLISSFAHLSTEVKNGIMLANGLYVYHNNANEAGIGTVFDRVLTELVSKIREMSMDRTELGCLRAIVLFNPDAKGLSGVQQVESLREKVYASLEEYCKQQFPDEPGRFAKLLLRLPALRSIGLKCNEHLFFSKLFSEITIETFLLDVLETSSN